jgi:hypothetical protein
MSSEKIEMNTAVLTIRSVKARAIDAPTSRPGPPSRDPGASGADRESAVAKFAL